ncbi:hypothetical protein VR44_27565, partial [Streptomyces katrae]
TGPWLPAPVVAAIAQKAEELLNAEAAEPEEPEEETELLVRDPAPGTVSGAVSGRAVSGPDAVTTTALPPRTPPPTAARPGRSPAGPA